MQKSILDKIKSIVNSIKIKFPNMGISDEDICGRVKWHSQKVKVICKTSIYQQIGNLDMKSKTMVLTVSRQYFSEMSLLQNTVFLSGMNRKGDSKVYYNEILILGLWFPFVKILIYIMYVVNVY